MDILQTLNPPMNHHGKPTLVISSGTSNNVVPFPLDRRPNDFDRLTAALVMERHRRGELDPEVLAALLAGVGLELPR